MTPLQGYSWAISLVEEMILLANDSTIKDMSPIEESPIKEKINGPFYTGPGYQCFYAYEHHNYVLHRFTHEHSKLKHLIEEKIYMHPTVYQSLIAHWEHGIVDLNELWPRLEELHYEVMTFQLDPNDRQCLLEYYDKVIETTWLLGNLTPTMRGTSKTVEQWFTMAHVHQHLRTPILRLENPQLDVLNITLPLSIYKERFFDYFEPESLPRPIAEMLAERKQEMKETTDSKTGKSAIATAITVSGGSPITARREIKGQEKESDLTTLATQKRHNK